ncbi:hypothetical protein DFH27DRAFT_543305 [Peziza echinospora]|nr:hypothetical protein DFH27DRAFT_543305 [Peziza echinospora]
MIFVSFFSPSKCVPQCTCVCPCVCVCVFVFACVFFAATEGINKKRNGFEFAKFEGFIAIVCMHMFFLYSFWIPPGMCVKKKKYLI